MTKSYKKGKRGGFLGMETSSLNPMNWFGKKEPSYSSSSYSSPTRQLSSYLPTSLQQSSTTQTYYGGKRRRSKRGGSYSPNMSLNNLASSASPISGIQTVKAQTWVGGKTKKRRNGRRNKSRKHH